MKPPKYLLTVHGDREWIVRTRNPFLIAEVITGAVSSGQITFDLWPCEIVRELGEQRTNRLTDSMYRWYIARQGVPYAQIERQLS